MIDTSPSSIRLGLVMLLGIIWFGLLIDTALRGYDESDE